MATGPRSFVDTDVLIDVARRDARALDFWRRTEVRSRMTCSVISVFELLAGCRNLSEQRVTLRSLATVEIVQVEINESRACVAKIGEQTGGNQHPVGVAAMSGTFAHDNFTRAQLE